jgi:hypothetical protein
MDIKDKALLMLKYFAEDGPYWTWGDVWGKDVVICGLCHAEFDTEEEVNLENLHHEVCEWRKAKEFILELYYYEYQFPVEEQSGEKEGESE